MAQDLNPTPNGDFGSLAIHDLLPERPALIGEFSPVYEAFREATIADLAPVTKYEYLQAQQLADRVAASAKAAATKDVIITGDFNEEPGEVLRVLEGAEVPLVDACRGWSANGDAAGPAFTTWKFRPAPGGAARAKGAAASVP